MITKRLSWYSPYSPDLNPIGFIWKSIKRTISIAFVENVEALRKIIERTFYKQTCRELIIC